MKLKLKRDEMYSLKRVIDYFWDEHRIEQRILVDLVILKDVLKNYERKLHNEIKK